MSEESEILRFFRPLMNNSLTKLFIPSPLAERVSRAKCRDRVTLVSHKCKMWHVGLHSENQRMYFGGRSWRNFVRDNDLEIGHTLFFKYKGNMVFLFRIYDLSSCERTSRVKKVAEEVTDVEETSPHTEEAVGCRRKRRGQENQRASEAEQAARCRKKSRGEEDRSAPNAFFEVSITARSRKNYLQVPAAFRECSGVSVDHTGCSIRDPEGRAWLIGLHHRGSSIRMSKGWRHFCRQNQVKAGDKLRFELVSAKGEGRVMQLNMLKL